MDKFVIYFIGCIIGFAISSIILHETYAQALIWSEAAHNAIDHCEIELPRNKHCVLTGVPNDG